MNPQTKTVARINKVDIVVIENGEKRIAVKPICEALGVTFEPQFTKIKNHPILASVITMNVTTGADGKQYEMVTIPYKYVFGWLFSIDARKVKPEAAESVLKYQTECYEVLYSHFTNLQDFLSEKTKRIEDQIDIAQLARTNYNTAKNVLSAANADLNIARNYSYEDFIAEKRQLQISFTPAEIIEPITEED